MKKCFLAGASGSIGTSTLSVLAHLHQQACALKPGEPSYELVGFSLKNRVHELIQVLKTQATAGSFINLQAVAIDEAEARQVFQEFLQTTSQWQHVSVWDHTEAALLASEADVLINAQSGSAGLAPTICALNHGMRILLANKESLVMGANLIRKILKEQGHSLKDRIFPIDSEHKALQTLSRGWKPHEVSKFILTASGGPFWDNWIENPTPEQALKHPNWEMGKKISIDSATMMNKGLEIIEAHVLFDIPYTHLEAIIHREQIIHSFIELVSGELLALFGANDMRYSIQGAMTYPEVTTSDYKPFRLGEHGALTFHAIPPGRYPLFELACTCGEKGGMFPLVLNAANEAAVHAFIQGRLAFKDIFAVVEAQLEYYEKQISASGQQELDYSLEAILDLNEAIQHRVTHQL